MAIRDVSGDAMGRAGCLPRDSGTPPIGLAMASMDGRTGRSGGIDHVPDDSWRDCWRCHTFHVASSSKFHGLPCSSGRKIGLIED